MTAFVDELAAPVPSSEAVPKGWEPYAEYSDEIGSAIVRLPSPDATERDLLIHSGFDPAKWQIAGKINVRRWMRYDQEWLYYYKFDVVAGETPEDRSEDVADLVQMIRKRKRKTNAVTTNGERDAFVFCASDWQIGKQESGIGTPQISALIADSIDRSVQRVKDLRKIGRRMPEGALVATGDLGEGTCGFYANQSYVIDLNRREQNRMVRSLLTYAIDSLAPLFEEFTVATVGGNHGENREGGKKIADDGDNDDVAQFECVKEAFDRSGVDNVRWVIPDQELSTLIELGGVPVGLTHGHLFTSGGKLAQAKALEWWKGQTFGLQAVAPAKILISSHFHHFSVLDHGGRTHFQTPAADPGSKWVRDMWGCDSPAGILTLRLDAQRPLGWDDVHIL
jgi:hypothetical protein